MSQTETGRARSIRVALPLSRAGFGLGTGILTTEGELPVEFLEPGDRIITHDRGAVALSRVIVRAAPVHEFVRLRPAALHPEDAGRDILISARQQIVLRGWMAQAMFGRPAALVEAGRLIDGDHISRPAGNAPARLFQLVFDDGRHILTLAGGRLLAPSAAVPVPASA